MHIPFALILTVLTLALSCVPAVLIWTIFSDLMDSTIDLLYASTTDGIDGLSNSVQDLLLQNSLLLLNSRISAGDTEAVSQESLLHATGLINANLHPNVTNISSEVVNRLRGYNFNIMKGNTMFSYLSMEGTLFSNGSTDGKAAYWIVWQALNIDIFKSMNGLPPYCRTLYLCTVMLSEDELQDTLEIWYVDQTTGVPLVKLSTKTYPWQALMYKGKEARKSWNTDLYINTYSGTVELTYLHRIFIGENQFSIGLGLNTQTLSDELRSQLSNHRDRLFLFFRNSNGHLIAASHGKYFSLSDKDFRYLNPIANPTNTSLYHFYTCLDSTDSLILEACQNLVALYRNWTLIPESRREMQLNGSRFWVAVGYSTSNLKATMVLLKDRQSVMGTIDASTSKVLKDTEDKRGLAAIVFGVATGVAAVMPLIVGLWLGHRLLRMAKGMDRIARLDFTGPSVPRALFHEIHNFQQSFLQMERGLRAFGKFVPSAVVLRLVAGHINTDDKMENATITIMFADIENFSTSSETMVLAQLAEVCTDYFEVMCKHVVQCDGTIDKFIGDCVMAMWNAPLPRPNHELSAVTAALMMQAEVLLLHEVWQQGGLPPLKFRLGLHTGHCLVGNFGCSYRISYTCLGSNVNLASRLESLNKKFGTVLCVSESTYAGCKDDFLFRHLSKVMMPGRSEAMSVYEVICSVNAEMAEAPGRRSLPRSLCSPSGMSPLLKQEGQEDIRLEPVESQLPDERKGKAKTVPQAPTRYKEDAKDHGECMVEDMSSTTSSVDREICIPYHWGWHDRQAVLREVAEYEAAYTALVEGRYTECRGLVAERQPDKAWQALAAQLEDRAGQLTPWDGVFSIREK